MEKLISYLISFGFLFSSIQNTTPDTHILLTGDVMLGRSVMGKSLGMNDPTYPFKNVAEKLNQADIVFSNLENPIISNCPPSTSGFKFCADPKMVEGLKFAGIDIVSLANNHMLNYGKEGKAETEKILTENGIKWVGDDNLEVIEKNGTKFGFLAFDYLDYLPKDSDFQLINDSKNKVDVLIVMVHWGKEYSPNANDFQKNTARNFVNFGADVVVGAHPHWVQETETVNGKPVFYSLGNFVFDQSWSEDTKKGLVIDLTYQNSALSTTAKLPIYMKNFVQPEWNQVIY